MAATYARSFFDLQLACARRVAAVSGMPLDRALLDYTNLYIRFGLGRGFDPSHPTWREYLAGLERAADGGAFTHHVYLALGAADGRPDVAAESGCFSCGQLPGRRIRLHFRDAEPDGSSPLSVERRPQRMAELAALFARVRQMAPEPPRVVGASWLYNLEAYRQLFPPAYLGTARAIYQHFGLDLSEETESAMREFVASNPQGKHGKHSYTSEEFGLSDDIIRSRFADYIARHNLD